MEITKTTLSLENTGSFPALLLDYLAEKEEIKPFYSFSPTLDGFKEAIQGKKNFSVSNRQVLVDVLEKQYKGFENSPSFAILLDENTFTVTTGHQLNIFTGPLYVIYKIITTINLSKKLKKAYPDYHFVPVYWMASEDHDFEEIASFQLFGKKYTWETAQTGAVGRMNPKEISALLAELPDSFPLFEQAYLENESLADAVRQYMHALFGADGLICLDADDADLKRLFLPVIEEDILTQTASQLVHTRTNELEELGYKAQIHARDINFFYLKEGLRARIIKEGENWAVKDTDIVFTEKEVRAEWENHPERFSPNVVLRPLYQEMILPNLAYIGGPSEVPYWLQLKGVFDHYGESFPILLPRNFALVVTAANQKKIDKLQVGIDEFFDDAVTLKKRYVERISEKSLSLAFEMDEIGEVMQRITRQASSIDATLKAVVEAEQAKIMHALTNLEKRIKKAEERNHETAIQQLLGVQDKLFPNGSLQERVENFLSFYKNDETFLDKLKDTFDPLDFQFNILN